MHDSMARIVLLLRVATRVARPRARAGARTEPARKALFVAAKDGIEECGRTTRTTRIVLCVTLYPFPREILVDSVTVRGCVSASTSSPSPICSRPLRAGASEPPRAPARDVRLDVARRFRGRTLDPRRARSRVSAPIARSPARDSFVGGSTRRGRPPHAVVLRRSLRRFRRSRGRTRRPPLRAHVLREG